MIRTTNLTVAPAELGASSEEASEPVCSLPRVRQNVDRGECLLPILEA